MYTSGQTDHVIRRETLEKYFHSCIKILLCSCFLFHFSLPHLPFHFSLYPSSFHFPSLLKGWITLKYNQCQKEKYKTKSCLINFLSSRGIFYARKIRPVESSDILRPHKFVKISHFVLTLRNNFKIRSEIFFPNFVVFSQYLNFKSDAFLLIKIPNVT